MTLEEMNHQWEAAHTLPAADTEEFDEDEEEFDADAALNEACDILNEVMETLGKMGKLRTHVGREEKKELLALANHINEFLVTIEDIDEEEDE